MKKANRIVLSGEPKSTNHIYKYSCTGNFPRMYMTSEGKALKEQYILEARTQWKGELLVDDVCMSIVFYFKNKRKRDLDNQNKLIMDSLEGIVYENDRQVSELSLTREYDSENPRIEIYII